MMCFSFVLNGVFLVTREKEDNIFFNIRHAMDGKQQDSLPSSTWSQETKRTYGHKTQ